MRATRAYRVALPRTRVRLAAALSSYAVGHQWGRFATFDHPIRVSVKIGRTTDCAAGYGLVTTAYPDALPQDDSMQSATPTLLPTTIPEDATLEQVASIFEVAPDAVVEPSRCTTSHLYPPTGGQTRAYSTINFRPVMYANQLEGSTTADVQKMLARSRSRIEKSGRSVLEQRDMAKRDKTGLRVLKWLKQLTTLDEEHTLSKRSCTDLGWLLVAENTDDDPVQWLVYEGVAVKPRLPRFDKHDFNGNNRPGRQLRRRHDLASGLVNGYLCLSLDGTANDAIRRLLSLLLTAQRRRVLYTFNWAGAISVLARHLESSTCVPCDPGLFDDLRGMVSRVLRTPTNIRKIACMSVYHPTSPDPWPALGHIKQLMQDPLPVFAKSVNFHYHGTLITRIMHLLRIQGALEEAQWAELVLRDRFPDVWSARNRIIEKFDRDPKLQHMWNSKAN